MKKVFKNSAYIATSVVVIALLFGGGYFIGKNSNEYKYSFSSLDSANANSEIDLSTFLKAWETLDKKFVSSTSTVATNEDRVYGAIKGMVDSMGDPYTTFFDPEENKAFNSSIEGNFEGVGMEVGIEEEILTVIAPLKGTPAEKAGIKKGDKILEISGKITSGMRVDEAVKLIRGKKGTTVSLTLFREGEKEPLKIDIVRDVIMVPALEYKKQDGVFIISFYSFSGNATADFKKAIEAFSKSGTNKLVLDLRGNPGGYLDAAVEIASLFLPQGKTVVSENFGKSKDAKVLRSKGYDVFKGNLKMVILMDKGSASASEILAGALQYHGVAKLMGTNSFGKGSVQELVPIDAKSALKVTIAQWLTPAGKSISDGGLTPDVLIDKAPEGIKIEDYQLQEAIKSLNK